jgi:Asp-tRNA(Asn)/Glu-tRNA(Gln) amidotransferase A subunit family amidase
MSRPLGRAMTEHNSSRGKLGVGLALLMIALLAIAAALTIFVLRPSNKISLVDSGHAQKLIDLDFNRRERRLMKDSLNNNRSSYREIRKIQLANDLPPALAFSPILPGMTFDRTKKPFPALKLKGVKRPSHLEELAFYSVADLAELIRTRQVTSVELTSLYLSRLKKYGPKLRCVITLTEDLALKQARRADDELAAGRYRGPLHGIPWGAKDLLAAKGIPTTWGAAPYKDQVFSEDAAVVKRLDEAGAVLVAKLSMGELAMDDVWFGGMTRNPWNPEEGSSGSSAGSAAATSAGLVAFALGTETWGSIVSPCTRCGVTGLRPTFGRVSRTGAMALSWSMDKIGPIGRTVQDCSLVFQAILGPDGQDLTVVDLPFNWDPALDLKSIRVGYLKAEFDREAKNKDKKGAAARANELKVLETLRSLGLKLIPFELPAFPAESLAFILDAESAAAFDELTRSNRDDRLARQGQYDWPTVFRSARFIPAVEYIQANRLRTKLMKAMAEKMAGVDVFVTPSFGGDVLLITNLTGHPAVVVPDGFDDKGLPTSISFIGNLFEEAKTLRVAQAYQQATDFHLPHPDIEARLAALK